MRSQTDRGEKVRISPAVVNNDRCKACRIQTPIAPFSMAFQPVVDLQDMRIDAYEALVRTPSGGGAAEVLAKVTPETMYAFDQACRVKAIEMAARLGVDRQLNINFLPNAVYQPRACIRTTLNAAARTGFRPDRLTFEIVETEAIADTSHLRNIIAEYRRQGFKVALDDFGTGHSGLARLAELVPDIVKVDRALVKDCDTNPVRLAIVAAMIRLCRDIGIKVVVEGVERIGEVEALTSVGARFIQGFYFAKPSFESIVGDDVVFPPSNRDDRLVNLAAATPLIQVGQSEKPALSVPGETRIDAGSTYWPRKLPLHRQHKPERELACAG